MRNFTCLTFEDRRNIEKGLLKNWSIKEIAEWIGKHESTIYREIKRATYEHTNTDLTTEIRYNPEKAQELYDYNKRKGGLDLKIEDDFELADWIEDKILNEKFSPRAVCYLLKNDSSLNFKTKITSPATIYSYIRKGVFFSLSMKNLTYYKKKSKKKIIRNKRGSAGTSIEKRPDYINDRSQFGHWEMDTVIGKISNKKNLLVLTERVSRFEIVEELKSHTCDEVRKALNRIEKRFGSSFYKIFNSITVDNGVEFSNPDVLEKALYRVGKRTKLYYCHPYCSCERGSNENANKLIRKHFGKGEDFDKILTREKIKKAEDWINNYPRRIFKGKTSSQIFTEELNKILLAA